MIACGDEVRGLADEDTGSNFTEVFVLDFGDKGVGCCGYEGGDGFEVIVEGFGEVEFVGE